MAEGKSLSVEVFLYIDPTKCSKVLYLHPKAILYSSYYHYPQFTSKKLHLINAKTLTSLEREIEEVNQCLL